MPRIPIDAVAALIPTGFFENTESTLPEAMIDGPKMQSKEVKTTHHEQPLVLTQKGGILAAEPGPFRNHTDDELIMLESLVGREPPFMKDGQYPAKKY